MTLDGERYRLRQAIEVATAALAEAGIDSARIDAELLAAHLVGSERGRLATIDPPEADFFCRYDEVIAARSRRIPLQHLTGTAAFGRLELQVGPGVFVPRPETEALLEWVVAQQLPSSAVIVDLCTGSGALAIALADRWPRARIIAVDDDAAALEYARRNAAGTAVELVAADVTTAGLLPSWPVPSTLWCATRPTSPPGQSWNPKWPSMTRRMRCSAARMGWQ